jgi:hypothetical protein
MKTNVTRKQQLSFNDVQVTITGKDFIGELHMSLADAADLAIGAELEISKPGIGSKTSSWLGNLFGTSDEALKAKIIDLQTALDKSNGKVSVGGNREPANQHWQISARFAHRCAKRFKRSQ